MAPTAKPLLDHIVILVPHATLLNLPPWLTNAFTVLAGGTHADGATENKLILLRDGVYLELIAFVPGHEDQRRKQRWGDRPEGRIIDWALSLPGGDDPARNGRPEDSFPAVQARVRDAGAGALAYADPVPGGRVRPDGVVLQWAVAAPQTTPGADLALVPGEMPFWCFDRTPRGRRVPYREGENAQHPSGAVGVAQVKVAVRDAGLFRSLGRVYGAVYGEGGETRISGVEGGVGLFSWDADVPESLEGARPAVSLSLNTAMQDDSIVEVVLYTQGGEERSVGGALAEGQRIEIKLEPL